MARIAPLAALLLTLGTALATSLPSKGAFPGQNGLIAYEVDGSICVMGPTGSAQTRLTYNSWLDSDPAWSADGRMLAVAQSKRTSNLFDRGIGIAVLADGTRTLIRSAADPSWSPDGRFLVHTLGAFRGEEQVGIMAADGSTRRALVSAAAAPVWSPDGGLIAYHRFHNFDPSLYVIQPDGSEERRLTDGSTPSWSPDGSKLAFWNAGLLVINRDGSDLRRLTSASPSSRSQGLAWSPDGAKIAFATAGGDVWVVNRDGRGERNLTKTPDLIESFPDWAPRASFERPRGARGCGMEIVDTENEQVVIGGPHDDLLYGLEGADRLRGEGGRDLLYGGRGSDLLLGGHNRDGLYGGSGSDLIEARDGERDEIFCGNGRDRVIADRRDRVARDCESVKQG